MVSVYSVGEYQQGMMGKMRAATARLEKAGSGRRRSGPWQRGMWQESTRDPLRCLQAGAEVKMPFISINLCSRAGIDA
jgi:hypothetical protein